MKRMLFAGALLMAAGSPALAADIIPPAAPPPRAPATYVPTAAPIYNWGGIYVGINGGYGFGSSTWTDAANPSTTAAGTTGSFSTNGGLVGGTVGANFQANELVFGIEADFDYAGLSGSSASAFCGSASTTAGLAAGASCQTKDDWLGTVRGRLGYAWDRVLLFATAGGAFGDVKAGLTTGAGYDTSTEFGWTAGAGVEVAITENWTAKAEYLFVDLSNGSCTSIANCGADGTTTTPVAPNDAVKFYANVVRAGVNFKFNPF